jgi:hypothetical protein
MINIKTQTRRATRWKENIINANMFINNIQIGVTTSASWGDYVKRVGDPEVTITIDGKYYNFTLTDFVKMVEKNRRIR